MAARYDGKLDRPTLLHSTYKLQVLKKFCYLGDDVLAEIGR